MFRKALTSKFVVSLLVGTVVGLAVIGLRATGRFEVLELAAYDLYLRMAPRITTPNPRIVLIAIDENDIGRLGQWPISDEMLADILLRLEAYEPRAIGLDIFRDLEVGQGIEKLNSVLEGHDNIVAATKLADGQSRGIPPPPALAGTDRVGFVDIVVDPGGIVRRGLLYIDDGREMHSSFALQLALLYLGKENIGPEPDPINEAYLRLGRTTFRPLETNDGSYVGVDAGGYQFLMDFRDGRSSFPNYSLEALLSGSIEPKAIRDKIVLIGVTAESVKDLFYSPLSLDLTAYQHIHGVKLHALMVSQLLRAALDGERPMRTLGETYEWAWIMLWSVAGSALGVRAWGLWRFSLWTVSGVAAIVASTFAAFLNGWWIPSVTPTFAWIVSAILVTAYVFSLERKEREAVMQLFSRYVDPGVAETLWQQREAFWGGGRPRSQQLTATVLFTDLKGFTGTSESLDPGSLMDWLNSYMDRMTELVMKHGGVLDDYAGDGMKADFGVPVPRKTDEEIRRDAINAVTCAIAMGRELVNINQQSRAQAQPTVAMRIGIYTGTVIGGSLGSTRRLKYTTVGDAVNTAARLESLDGKLIETPLIETDCRILIGESTLDHLGGKFPARYLGKFLLKGKTEKITVYQVTGEQDGTPPAAPSGE